MKLSELRQHYYSHTSSASTAVRQIAFAGVAVVWIFKKTGPDGTIVLPNLLLTSLIFLCATLAADLLQYTLSSAVYGFYGYLSERKYKHREDPELRVPEQINWPGILMFWTKQILLVLAYAAMFTYLIRRITVGET